MKTIKLNNNQAELVLKAISAFIREEERGVNNGRGNWIKYQSLPLVA